MIKTEKNTMVPMPDGINLATDLYFPDESGGPWPVLLMRNPYDKNLIPINAEQIASDGVVFVMQYVRGCYESEGQFHPLANERRDGAATIAWLQEQAWCNGRIGTVGSSRERKIPPPLVRLSPPA